MRIGQLFHTLLLISASLSVNAQVADAGADQWVCGDSAFAQGVNPGAGYTGTWSVASGSGVFFNNAYSNSQVTGLSFGDNELVWTVTDGVTTTTDTALIVAYDPSVTSVWTMGDTAITGPPFSITLFASPYSYPQFCNWLLVAGTANIYQPNAYTTVASQLSPGVNAFRWQCDNGPCGVHITQLNIVVYIVSTSVLETAIPAPFYFDATTGSLRIVSELPITELQIRDLNGREVTGYNFVDGIYIASAVVGGKFYTQRFVVSR